MDSFELFLQEEKAFKNWGVGQHIADSVGDFAATGHFLENASWLISSYLRADGNRAVKKLAMAGALIAMEIDTALQADADKKKKENLANEENRKKQFEAIRVEAEKLIDEKITKVNPSKSEILQTVRTQIAQELNRFAINDGKPKIVKPLPKIVRLTASGKVARPTASGKGRERKR